MLAFDCYLRIGEMTNIQAADVVNTDRVDSRLGGQVFIRLPKTKAGVAQSVTIQNPTVAAMVWAIRNDAVATNSSGSLFGVTKEQYRRRFKFVCSELKLSDTFVPHSLRHGGATTDYMLKVPVVDIKVRGRWSQLKTVERYMQAGEAAIGSVFIPDSVIESGERVARDLAKSLTSAARAFNAARTAASRTAVGGGTRPLAYT